MDFLFARRSRLVLVGFALCLAAAYLATIFDADFVLGNSPFWQNPSGPWLLDAADAQISSDMLTSMAGYFKYAQSPWQLPLLLVPGLGPPGGTSGIFLDVIPIVAILGKLATHLSGTLINPYGVWIVVAFTLSAVFTALIVAETSAANIVGVCLAVILAISAPPLLHRFGHLVMFAHFSILAGLWLCLVDRKMTSWRSVAACWTLLLATALLVGVYVFVLTGALYTASWIDRRARAPASVAARYGEPIAIAVAIAILMVLCGHVGQGTAPPFSNGFGYFSMNLVSPFWPQRSGVFASMWPIIDATGGQYEGFNYFGAGGLLVIGIAAVRWGSALPAAIARHKGFAAIMAVLVIFSISNRVYFFDVKLLDYSFSWRVDYIIGIFRSSGRFFWPVYYACLIGGAVAAIAGSRRQVALGIALAACGLQFIDSEPLRARMAELSRGNRPMHIDASAWRDRIAAASNVFVAPSYGCAGPAGAITNMELGFLAARANKDTNTVYNPRGRTDCTAEQAIAVSGPWRAGTLHVFLKGAQNSLPDDAIPSRFRCEKFPDGTWCIGPK